MLSAALPAAAQEAVTLRFKDSVNGDIVAITRTEEASNTVRVVDPVEKVLLEKAEKRSSTFIWQETILDKEPQQLPTRLRRRYEKAQVQIGDKKEVLPFEGKTVLIEKHESKYRFQLDGGIELTGKEAHYLDSEFNSSKLDYLAMRRILLPGKAVKINEEWRINSDPVIKDLAQADGSTLGVDRERATATGKVLAVYTREGRQFGKISFTLEFPLTEVRQGDKRARLQQGAKMSLNKTIDACIDGGALIGGMGAAMQFDAVALLEGGTQGKMFLSSKLTLKETQREMPRR
jgi:hypothetical protein